MTHQPQTQPTARPPTGRAVPPLSVGSGPGGQRAMAVTQADLTAVTSAALEEVHRAEAKYPEWPTDQVHAAAIVAEEAGELIRAALNESYHSTPPADTDREAIQTIATCVRFLAARRRP